MKRFFLFFLLTVFFLLSGIKSSVFAQAPLPVISVFPIYGDTNIYGTNCGNSESTTTNRCCWEDPNISIEDELNQRLPQFLCLIDVGGIKGFCVNDLMKIPARWVTQLPMVESLVQLKRLNSTNPCVNGNPSTDDYSSSSCICLPTTLTLATMCEQYLKNTPEYSSCVSCEGVWTGMGCMKADLQDFITDTLLKIGVSLAGLIALFCIIYSAVQLQTSAGNPEKVKKAQELLTSCIMGLMLIIFSVFILRLIGVNILRIPFFS